MTVGSSECGRGPVGVVSSVGGQSGLCRQLGASQYCVVTQYGASQGCVISRGLVSVVSSVRGHQCSVTSRGLDRHKT